MSTTMVDAKTGSRKRAAMTGDQLCGHIEFVLAAPLSHSQTVQTLLSRVNGTEPTQLLAAALAVAREQYAQRIRELERALAESEEAHDQLECDLHNLRNGLKGLLAEGR